MPFNHPYGMILDEIQALVAAYIFGVNKDNSIDGTFPQSQEENRPPLIQEARILPLEREAAVARVVWVNGPIT
ncbi:hypothetical protein JHK87_024509 [Glycine soja]|nr:hypothetical protein JHK87_024509 [Glycine soja]